MATKSTALSSIIVSKENADALDAALSSIKGRAKVFPSASTILCCVGVMEGRLAKAGVAISNRPGCTYTFREAGPTANAYKYAKTVITFSLKRTARGWVVTHAGSEEVYPKQSRIDRIYLTSKAREAVIRAALDGFGVIPAKAA